jgi:hypothetical protein
MRTTLEVDGAPVWITSPIAATFGLGGNLDLQ